MCPWFPGGEGASGFVIVLVDQFPYLVADATGKEGRLALQRGVALPSE